MSSTIIFNQSIQDGIFPDLMKCAEVITLHKGKEYDLVVNYQPISLLITVSKVLEKLIYSRVYNFLKKKNKLYNSQYGFRSHHLCKHAITELISHVLQSKNDEMHSVALFLDLSKAFDTLNHNVLW